MAESHSEALSNTRNLSGVETRNTGWEGKPVLRKPTQKCSSLLCRGHSGWVVLESGHWGFPDGSDGKESACNAGDRGSIPGSGRSPGEGNGNALQYSCLGNSMNRGAWWNTVCGIAETDATERPTLSLSIIINTCNLKCIIIIINNEHWPHASRPCLFVNLEISIPSMLELCVTNREWILGWV